MIADIFYPIFTLTITVLACFIQKEIGGYPHQGISLDRPAAIVFGFAKNRCVDIFSVLFLVQLPCRSISFAETSHTFPTYQFLQKGVCDFFILIRS